MTKWWKNAEMKKQVGEKISESMRIKNLPKIDGKYKISINGCWLWQGAKDQKGYGLLRFKSKLMRAHNVSFIITNGPIPPKKHLYRSCEDNSCINPSHLSIGKRAALLTDEQIQKIKPLLRAGYHPETIAKDMGLRVIDVESCLTQAS